jgi:hypothetical protein
MVNILIDKNLHKKIIHCVNTYFKLNNNDFDKFLKRFSDIE